MIRSFVSMFVFCALVFFLNGNGTAFSPSVPQVTEKARYWSGESGTPQIVIIDRGADTYRVLFIGGEPLDVNYRTEMNSTIPVVRILDQVDAGVPGVQAWDFRHSFSRTTVWMALEFSRNGRVLNELGRTFYDNLDGVR